MITLILCAKNCIGDILKMLEGIEVKNFVNIAQANLALPNKGFCVLTGETGVGKSLLIDAVTLALGGKQQTKQIKENTEQAEVTLSFNIHNNITARNWLRQQAMQEIDGQLIVRRVITINKRSKIYINGNLATLSQLDQLVNTLIEICGQHEQLRLKQAIHRQELLDQAANAKDNLAKTAKAYKKYQELSKELLTANKNAENVQERINEIEVILTELNNLNFSKENWEENNRLLTVYENANEVKEIISNLNDNLDNLNEELNKTLLLSNRLAEILPESKTIDTDINTITSLSTDLSRDVAKYTEKLEVVDKEAHSIAENFVAEALTLTRKYKLLEPIALIEFKEKLEQELEGLSSQSLEQLEKEVAKAKEEYLKEAKELTNKRKEKAEQLNKSVQKTVRDLAMPDARFKIELTPLDKFNQNGLEEINFIFNARKTGKLNPIEDVASGGELSRLTLALFSQVGGDGIKDMVFDEVDAGISGKTAAIVGNLLNNLGNERLVLCVTHLPQVAAAAEHHWLVTANEDGVASFTKISKVEREEEIARMLAGRKITQASRNNAKEIMAMAAAR